MTNAELTAKLAAALKAVMPYANADNDFGTDDFRRHNAALSEARAALAEYDKRCADSAPLLPGESQSDYSNRCVHDDDNSCFGG